MMHWLSGWAPWSYIVFFLVIALVMVPLSLRRARYYRQAQEVQAQYDNDLHQRGQRATGQVVDYETVSTSSYSNGNYVSYAPIISFFTPDGRENRFRAGFRSAPKAFVPGHQVTVLYDPYNLQNSRVESYNWEDKATITRGYKLVRPLFTAFPLVPIAIFLVIAAMMFGVFLFIISVMGA